MFYTFLFPFSFLISCYFCRLRRFRFRRLRFHRSCLRPFLFVNLVVALQENLHCIHLYVLYLPFPMFFFGFLLLLSFAPVPFSPASFSLASFSPVLFASLPFFGSFCASATRQLTPALVCYILFTIFFFGFLLLLSFAPVPFAPASFSSVSSLRPFLFLNLL